MQPEFSVPEGWRTFFQAALDAQEARIERLREAIGQARVVAGESFTLRRYCDLETHEDCEGGCWLSD